MLYYIHTHKCIGTDTVTFTPTAQCCTVARKHYVRSDSHFISHCRHRFRCLWIVINVHHRPDTALLGQNTEKAMTTPIVYDTHLRSRFSHPMQHIIKASIIDVRVIVQNGQHSLDIIAAVIANAQRVIVDMPQHFGKNHIDETHSKCFYCISYLISDNTNSDYTMHYLVKKGQL